MPRFSFREVCSRDETVYFPARSGVDTTWVNKEDRSRRRDAVAHWAAPLLLIAASLTGCVSSPDSHESPPAANLALSVSYVGAEACRPCHLQQATTYAETGMGRSLLAKYQDEDIRPGRYMPKEMRKIGWELHNAATQFAKAARKDNLQETLQAYHRITSACVACHYSYRTR